MLNRKDFEIMSPAGGWDCLHAGINAGADAVYFGVGNLNMRSAASRTARAFTVDDIARAAATCADAGVRSYLTVNTIIYEHELDEMRELLAVAKEGGISAIIASDVAVMDECVRIGIPVHLSTQLNISNSHALRHFARYAEAVVLARELSLDQVRRIHDCIITEPILGPTGEPVRIEMFCHGALCMGVSGRCYMSLHTRDHSANRGRCLMPCRREYIVRDTERDIEMEMNNGYVLSPKDLKTIGIMDQMVAAGVRIFKIEGRARGAEYVSTVTTCYREALEAVLEGRFTDAMRTSWDDRLATVFNRGFWEGFYLGSETAQFTDSYGSKATQRKIYIGKCVNYYPKSQVGEFVLNGGEFDAGDRLLITGSTTGAVFCEPEDILVNDVAARHAPKGSDVTFRVGSRIRENDQLYRLKRLTED